MSSVKPHDRAAAFVCVATVHVGDVQWWWAEQFLHDADYHIKVNDSMDKQAAALADKYNIDINTRFCCQWEGMQFQGDNLENVSTATQELARHLARFKGVRPLVFD